MWCVHKTQCGHRTTNPHLVVLTHLCPGNEGLSELQPAEGARRRKRGESVGVLGDLKLRVGEGLGPRGRWGGGGVTTKG